MAQFVIDTSKISNVRTNVTSKVLPKINNSYNTVVSVKSNLPSSVLWRKWNNSNLSGLYNDIDSISDDIIKLSNTLYKAIERMDNAEKIINNWWKLKNDVVDKGKVIKTKAQKIKSELDDAYDDASEWLSQTGAKIDAFCQSTKDNFEIWCDNAWVKFKEDPFTVTRATIASTCQSILKGLLSLLETIVDLALIVGTIAITPFTALADGVNYLITGETGGYTSYYWDGTKEMVSDLSSLVDKASNWLDENSPDWVKENTLVESGGFIDQVIQGVTEMFGIVAITMLTFGAVNPVSMAIIAGPLGFAKGTSGAWEDGKDTVEGLLLGVVNGGWEALQYYLGCKIGMSCFSKITANIGNVFLQKLAVSGIRVSLDTLTGAVEVPFQSLVLMLETRLDNVEGNEVNFEQAWEESGGVLALFMQSSIAFIGSGTGEIFDIGKAGKNAYKNNSSLDVELKNIYDADLNNSALARDNSFDSKINYSETDDVMIDADGLSQNFENVIDDAEIEVKSAADVVEQVEANIENVVEQVEATVEEVIDDVDIIAKNVDSVLEPIDDTFENAIKNDINDNIISDDEIAIANYRAGKGTFTSFKFDDASKLPDLDSNFWKNIEHPEQTFIYVDGKNMTFDEALIYKQSYSSYIKDVNINEIDNLSMDSLDYSKTNPGKAAAAKFASSAKRYVYNDTNKFIGLNKRIADNGLYHFTNSADAIMDSGYIKATGETFKSKIMGESYGRPKTFFFEGIPEAGAFATNIDTVPLKTTAIKVDPTADVLNSPNLKVRNLDDGAITWDGRFDLTDQKVSKQYFVLTVDEGKLKYINVPESVYNSYDNTVAGKQLAEFINNKKNIQAIKDDYLVNTSLKGTNAQISNNSKIISLYDRSKTILMDKAGFVDFTKLKRTMSDVNPKLNDLNELTNANLNVNDSLQKFNNAKRFTNEYDIAIKYNDSKQYLYLKLKDLAASTNDSRFVSLLKDINTKRNLDKSYDELYSIVGPYLDDADLNALRNMNPNDYNSKFTAQDCEELYMYSAATGPALTAYERGTKCRFKTRKGLEMVYDGTNRKHIEDLINYSGRKPRGMETIDLDENVKRIDNIIKKSGGLDEDTILYRGVDSLFFDGEQLSLGDLKAGQIINDKATISTSLMKDKAYSNNNIMLEIYAPKGTNGAYIESFVGGYSQQEVLLGRNTKFKVVSDPEIDISTGKATIKVEVLSPDTFFDKIKNTKANVVQKFKNKFIDTESKNNITAELEDNVSAQFTSNKTEELLGNYPNQILN